MKQLFIIIVILLIFTNNVTALQVGDGQYTKTYNNQDLSATQARFNNITTKGAGGGVPVGSIIAWPVASNPEDMENWLECNGQAVNAAMYPELRAVIGAKVPDLRGLFLRGYGGNSDALGIQQDYATSLNDIETTIQFGTHDWGTTVLAIGKNCCGYRYNPNLTYPFGKYPGFQMKAKFINTTSANETRPTNMAVRYLIRALP